MSKVSSALAEHPLAEHPLGAHEFREDTSIFYKSFPEKDSGWYFPDNNGVLFGPIHDEVTARKMLAELTIWFEDKKAAADV